MEQSQLPIPEQPTPSSSKKFLANPKLPLIAAAVVIILAIAGILLLKAIQPASPAAAPAPVTQTPPPQTIDNQQSPIDTSDWQTYRSEEYGFEVRYPRDWVLEDISVASASPFDLAIDPDPIELYVLDAPIAAIQIHLNRCWKQQQTYPCQNTVSEAAENRKSSIREDTLKEKTIDISGKEGVRISGIHKSKQPFGAFYTDVVIVPWDNDDQLVIELMKSEFENVFDQILSTFLFIDKTAETPKDKETCHAQDGTWLKAGLAQQYMCIFTYSDGGISCQSSDECEGPCVVYNETQGQSGKGTCKQDSNPFGCYATIENFKAGQGILCVD